MVDVEAVPVAAPGRSRRTWAIVAAVVFLLAATAFGVLWFVERGNHRAAAGQLGAVESEIRDLESGLRVKENRIAENMRLAGEFTERMLAAGAAIGPRQACVAAIYTFSDYFATPEQQSAALELIHQRCR